jgi:2-phosphosulfolactate phosphatase
MKLDVLFSPAGLAKDEVAGRAVFVIDVLRATTVACAALCHGARGILPARSIDEAIRLSAMPEAAGSLLIGERAGRPIPGFALGNSPLEMTENRVRDRTLVMTTTNGTNAMLATEGATFVYLAAAANLTVAGARARELLGAGRDVVILCAGRSGGFSLDDAYTAGRLAVLAIGGGPAAGLNDAGLAAIDLAHRYGDDWQRPLERSAAGRHLIEIGYGADVSDAARQDQYPALPELAGRRIRAAIAA